jgi:hypothetical protein
MNARKLIIPLLLVPTVLFANAGSPIIWFGTLHLIILNAIIGLIESSIIRWHEFPHRTLMIVIANYVSMIIGFFFIVPLFSPNGIGHGQYYILRFVIGMIVSYLATLAIEFPFLYFALKDKQSIKIIFKPFLIANTVTNVGMILIYLALASA